MKSRWTATTWEANSSEPATAKQSTPLSPTIASRCFWRSASGWPRRQASMNSSAQPIASTHSTSRTSPSTTVLLPSQKTKPCQTSPSTTGRRTTAAISAEPDPQGDPADASRAGHELGGAGERTAS